MSDLYINDVAASSIGLVVSEIAGWRDAPALTTPSSAVPPAPGVVATSTPREQPRPLIVRGLLRGSSKADVLSKADYLNLLCQGTSAKLAVPDGLSRHIFATLEMVAYPTIPGHFATQTKDYPVELRFSAQKPYFLDDALTSVGSGVDMPLGNAPVQPLLTLTGASATGVTFTLRNTSNVAITTLAFPTLVLAGGDTLIVDCEAKTAKKNGTSVLDQLSETTDFFKVDPAVHANYVASLWPDITVNAGTLTNAYRKAWR